VVPTQESAVSDSRRDCLAYASECVRLAGLAHDLQIREELLSLADDWMAKGIFRTTSDPQMRHCHEASERQSGSPVEHFS
jgi:hypothetical protein